MPTGSRLRQPKTHSILTIRKTIAVHRTRLLALPNVVYIGIGRKVIRGLRTDVLVIRVFVSKKRALRIARHRIPTKLLAVDSRSSGRRRFILTDVEERPRRHRALLTGGDAINGKMRGTVGVTYDSVSGRRLLLTNAHVVASLNATGIGRSVFVVQDGVSIDIGVVSRMLKIRSDRLNKFDGAIVKPSVPTSNLSIASPPVSVSGYGTLTAGSSASFFYFSRGRKIVCAHPQPILSEVAIDYPGGTAQFADFVELDVVVGTAVGGHSGALLVRTTEGGVLACGLVFAGDGDHVLVCPIVPLLKALSSASAGDDGSEENVAFGF